MKISEVIAHLQKVLEEEGDLPVYLPWEDIQQPCEISSFDVEEKQEEGYAGFVWIEAAPKRLRIG